MMWEYSEWVPRIVTTATATTFGAEGYAAQISLSDDYGSKWTFSTELVDTAHWRKVDLVVAALAAGCQNTQQIGNFVSIIDGREVTSMYGPRMAESNKFWTLSGGRGKLAVYTLAQKGVEHSVHLHETTDGYKQHMTLITNMAAAAVDNDPEDEGSSEEATTSTQIASPDSGEYVTSSAELASRTKRARAASEHSDVTWDVVKQQAEEFIAVTQSSGHSGTLPEVRARVQELFNSAYPLGINIDSMVDDKYYKSIALNRELFMNQALQEYKERQVSSVQKLYIEARASIDSLSAELKKHR